MRRVRSKKNKSTELRMIMLFRKYGITGWRRGLKLPGNPDFAFPRHKLAVFVDGCFWHNCPAHYRRPKSRRIFWDAKVRANVCRDFKINELLVARA